MDELIKEEWQKPPTPLEFPSGLHLSPPDSPHSKVPTQAQEINGIGSSCDSLLAEEAMVHYPPTVEHIGSASSPVISRPALSGSSTSSKPGEAASDGLEAERARFLDQGCSQKEVETLLQARRPTTNSTYRRVWEKFFYLRTTARLGLSLSISVSDSGVSAVRPGKWPWFKVQVSALSALTRIKCAQHLLVIQFQRACLKLRPPRKPSFLVWDLSIVLKALSKVPFFPLEHLPLGANTKNLISYCHNIG